MVSITSRIILIALLLFVLVACKTQGNPAPVVPDNSLLTGKPCSPPCWQGLIPGKSTLDEVDIFLKESDFVNKDSVERFGSKSKGVAYSWWWAGQQESQQLFNRFDVFPDNTLQMITIKSNVKVDPKQVIKTYGLPILVSVAVSGPNADSVSFYALYSEQKFSIQWYEDRRSNSLTTYCPRLDAPISEINYYSTDLMDSETEKLRDLMRFSPVGGGAGGAILPGNTFMNLADGLLQLSCIRIR
jgi:hypothetical protein